jgi:hypothetical protein
MMTYYEIYFFNNKWEIWKYTNYGLHAELFKTFKTKKGAENWAAKQWYQVIWK